MLSTRLIALLALAGAGLLPITGPVAQDLPGEIARLRRQVESVLPDAERPAALARLDRAASAHRAGRHLLAVYELEPPWEAAASFAFVRDARRVESVADFTSRWSAAGEPSGPRAPDSSGVPLAIEALAVAAEARGPALYRASLPYAQDADVPNALYYLGESRAVGAFGAFVRELRFPPPGARPALRPLYPDIDALDVEMTRAYEDMRREEHPAWVNASVTLKRARALSEQKHLPGALLEYLLARYRFAVLRKGPLPDPPPASRVAEARAALPADTDHSIARLFLEMAEAALESPNVAVRRSAALILDDVVPAYHAAMRPPTSDPLLTKPAVTITLVRWPFT